MIMTKTPLRCSFFGGGTDFKNYFENSPFGYGQVLSTALSMHVYIIINKRFDDKIRLVYNGNELVDDVNELKHNIIRESMKMVGVDKGIEIIYLSDLPMTNLGVGLASSSALSVGCLHALHVYKGENVSKEQLAKEAIDLEINHLGQRIGIQDQYAVAFGGFNRYKFNKDDTVDVDEISLSNKKEFFNNFLFFYTGSGRDSTEIFKEQNKTISNDRERLDPLVKAVDDAINYIDNKQYDKIGELLNETWQIKKKFASGVSNALIDDMYNKAILSGSIGGKILGAGGGGFMLLYVPVDKQTQVRKALQDYKEIKFSYDDEGTRVVYSD